MFVCVSSIPVVRKANRKTTTCNIIMCLLWYIESIEVGKWSYQISTLTVSRISHARIYALLQCAWPRGTGIPQLPSAVTSIVHHPLVSPSLLQWICIHTHLHVDWRWIHYWWLVYNATSTAWGGAVLKCDVGIQHTAADDRMLVSITSQRHAGITVYSQD